jgi:hypothetical protein
MLLQIVSNITRTSIGATNVKRHYKRFVNVTNDKHKL